MSALIRQLAPLVALPALVFAGCGGNDDKVSGPPPSAPETIEVTSSELGAGRIPSDDTCDGEGSAPTISFSHLPAKTKAVAFLLEDPDASDGSFVHWSLFNVDPKTNVVNDHLTPAPKAGRNSAGNNGYAPPCPPEGDGPHHYTFSVYALREPLRLGEGAAPAIVRQGIREQAIAKGTVTATYER